MDQPWNLAKNFAMSPGTDPYTGECILKYTVHALAAIGAIVLRSNPS